MRDSDDFVSQRAEVVPTQLVVQYANGRERVFDDRNWHIERVGRDEEVFLVIGHGIPCVYVPLANVLSFAVMPANH